MNNKGFAITGILYTLFVFFVLLIVASLTALSYKRTTLEKTISGLSDDFLFVTGDEANTLTWVNKKNNKYFANFDGKYIFNIKDNWNNVQKTCYAYLNKGDEITPDSFEGTLLPNDCNTFLESLVLNSIYFGVGEANRLNNLNIIGTETSLEFGINTIEKNNKIIPIVDVEHDFILTKAYKFRGSE